MITVLMLGTLYAMWPCNAHWLLFEVDEMGREGQSKPPLSIPLVLFIVWIWQSSNSSAELCVITSQVPQYKSTVSGQQSTGSSSLLVTARNESVTGCYNKLVDIASRDLLSAPLQKLTLTCRRGTSQSHCTCVVMCCKQMYTHAVLTVKLSTNPYDSRATQTSQ